MTNNFLRLSFVFHNHLVKSSKQFSNLFKKLSIKSFKRCKKPAAYRGVVECMFYFTFCMNGHNTTIGKNEKFVEFKVTKKLRRVQEMMNVANLYGLQMSLNQQTKFDRVSLKSVTFK